MNLRCLSLRPAFHSASVVVLALLAPPSQVLAQSATDSAFLACASHADRGQRIACLEDALERAVAAQNAARQSAASPPVATTNAAPTPRPVPAPSAAEAPRVAETPAAAENEERSLLDRVRAFGQRATVTEDADGSERLHDVVTAIEKRSNLLIVTLASGQVWRQQVARTLNLRVGDEVEIYQEGIGNGFRMSTPRLSGFIRVERTK